METNNDALQIISIVADFITIAGVIAAIRFAMQKKSLNLIGFQISLFLHYLLRIAIILIVSSILFRASDFFYRLILPLFKNVSETNLYWEKNKEIQHVLAYFITISIFLSITWILITFIWTSSWNLAKDYFNLFLPKNKLLLKREPLLEILNATYGTEQKQLDVTDILRQMVIKNSLTVTASNKLAGDPHYGEGKKLIISYRIGQKNYKSEILEHETMTIPVKNAPQQTVKQIAK